MKVSGVLPNKKNKRCLCVSLGGDRYFLVDYQRCSMYDDFKISKSSYDFLDRDGYIGCSEIHSPAEKQLVKRCGEIYCEDMAKILDRVKNSKNLSEASINSIVPELEKWIEKESLAEEKMKDIFDTE